MGLAVLHVGYLGVGAAVLFALRGWSLRLLGVAYLLGLATLGVVWTFVLVAGVPYGPGTILVTAVLVAGACVGIGVRRGFRVELSRARLSHGAALTAVGIALLVVYLASLFRVARLLGVFSFDGWAFWVTRGKAVYFFDALDPQVFASVPHPSYPPLIPILDAAAFHAMGGPDAITLHVQYWCFAVGFVAAVAGLLARRVPPWILWPSLLLALVLPRMRSSVLAVQADLPLDYLLVAAAILLALWLADRQPWRLHAVAILLCGAALVKREGLVLSACLLVAALAATAPSWRSTWSRLALVGLAVAAVGIPWRLWYEAHGIDGELGAGGLGDLVSGHTIDSLRLAADVLWDTGLWSAVPTVGVAAVFLAAFWGSRSLAVFAGVLVLLLTLAGASTSVVFPEVGVTADEAVSPIVRLTAGTALALGCLTPLLLAGVWAGRATRSRPKHG